VRDRQIYGRPFTLDPGLLRHEIVIEQPPTERSASGAVTGDWIEVVRLRAKFDKPQEGSERFGASAFGAESISNITTRWREGITKTMRVRFGTRYFDIIDINIHEERNRWMTLVLREGRSHGSANVA